MGSSPHHRRSSDRSPVLGLCALPNRTRRRRECYTLPDPPTHLHSTGHGCRLKGRGAYLSPIDRQGDLSVRVFILSAIAALLVAAAPAAAQSPKRVALV